MIGPVHENETRAKVKAIKKIPTIPPLSAARSERLTQDEGRVISKAPKEAYCKDRQAVEKKKMFIQGLVDKRIQGIGAKNDRHCQPNKRVEHMIMANP